MDGCALGLVAARKIQLSLRPGTRLPLSRGVTSGLGAGGGSLARDGWRERHVPAGPVSGEDGRQNSNSRGAGGARGEAAGPPGRADVSGGSGRQRTPIREEWWCQAGGPTLRRGGGPPATTRDATRGVRLSEIQRMQRDRQEEASAEECTLCTESSRSRPRR